MGLERLGDGDLTIDELAIATGTTTRSIRSFQTQGLMERPILRGRTGLYSARHVQRLSSILRLQAEGFSLQSLSILFGAHERGESLSSVLGLPISGQTRSDDADEAELYGFVELQRNARRASLQRGRPLLSIVPTTVWSQTEAS
jgi:DNA-binding transcriptional MerR regulator